ncbi:MAG: hypothetical protein AB7O52_13220 [Planctomycetota bacterium]
MLHDLRRRTARVGIRFGLALGIVSAAAITVFAGPRELATGTENGAVLAHPTTELELHRWLVDQMARVPANDEIPRITREELPRFHKLVDDAIAGGEYFVQNFPTSPARPAVGAILGRLLILNHTRYVVNLDNQYQEDTGERMAPELLETLSREYLDRIETLVRDALAESCRVTGLLEGVRGDTCVLQQAPLEAAKAFAASLAVYPENPNADFVDATRIDALVRGEAFEVGATEARAYLEQRPRSPYLADVFFMLHKSLRHSGRLNEGLEAWKKWGPILRAIGNGEPVDLGGGPWTVPEGARAAFRRYADRESFYLGFYEFALGKLDSAVQHLETFLDLVNSKEAAGEAVDPSTRVYWQFQAIPMLHIVTALVGRPAPTLNPTHWLVPPDENVGPGRVSLVLFCPSTPKNNRQIDFFPRLAKIAGDHWAEGLRVYWIADMRLSKERTLSRFEDEGLALIEKLDLNYPLGLDAGPDIAVHRAYGLDSTGTAHLYAVDRQGRATWYLIDPTERDEGLIRRVVERLLKDG